MAEGGGAVLETPFEKLISASQLCSWLLSLNFVGQVALKRDQFYNLLKGKTLHLPRQPRADWERDQKEGRICNREHRQGCRDEEKLQGQWDQE